MFLKGHDTLGISLFCAGIIGAVIRYTSNFGLISKYAENDRLDEDEKSQLLRELSSRSK